MMPDNLRRRQSPTVQEKANATPSFDPEDDQSEKTVPQPLHQPANQSRWTNKQAATTWANCKVGGFFFRTKEFNRVKFLGILVLILLLIIIITLLTYF
jgi:hypothetical protein